MSKFQPLSTYSFSLLTSEDFKLPSTQDSKRLVLIDLLRNADNIHLKIQNEMPVPLSSRAPKHTEPEHLEEIMRDIFAEARFGIAPADWMLHNMHTNSGFMYAIVSLLVTQIHSGSYQVQDQNAKNSMLLHLTDNHILIKDCLTIEKIYKFPSLSDDPFSPENEIKAWQPIIATTSIDIDFSEANTSPKVNISKTIISFEKPPLILFQVLLLKRMSSFRVLLVWIVAVIKALIQKLVNHNPYSDTHEEAAPSDPHTSTLSPGSSR